MAKATYPAVAKFGTATENQAKALAAAAIEIVAALNAAGAIADQVMTVAKADFGYDKRDDKGKSTWRTFAKKATRVGADWDKLSKEEQDGFKAGTRGYSLDSLFKALTADENKAASEQRKAEKAAEEQAKEEALREEITASLGGKMQIIGMAEMIVHVASHIQDMDLNAAPDEELGAVLALNDVLKAKLAAHAEALANAA